MSRFQFVADHQDAFEVKRLCELVEVERSSFYAWLKAAPVREARAAADAELAEKIRAMHAEDNTIGAPRATAEVNDSVPAGERVNHKRVARVMREHGIRGYQKRRRVRTTIPEPSGQKVPDLLGRDFTAQAPNQRYVGDITYLPLADGSNLYLATVIDCYSRRLVGWAVADHMRTSLVEDALQAAAATRGSLSGAIFHSDHGSVYTSKDYARLCAELGVTQSMGAVGSSADNALAEAFNATLKREVLQDTACWPDEATCRRQVFRWLIRYNTRRRHSWCRYQSPSTYESHYAATLPSMCAAIDTLAAQYRQRQPRADRGCLPRRRLGRPGPLGRAGHHHRHPHHPHHRRPHPRPSRARRPSRCDRGGGHRRAGTRATPVNPAPTTEPGAEPAEPTTACEPGRAGGHRCRRPAAGAPG